MKILIETIPHREQRYPTVGDYFIDDAGGHIRISRMDNPDYEFLVALHELIEAYLVQKRGIPFEHVDAFDIAFEKARAAGEVAEEAEPGDDPKAPYHREHHFASMIERFVASQLEVDWEDYEKAVRAL